MRADPSNRLCVPPPPVEWRQSQPGWRPFDLDHSIDRSWWAGHEGDGASAHFNQDLSLPGTFAERGTGIRVSGGGIRSATVTLGALQGLRSEVPLATVDDLVSVSGGGYMTGGFQMALTAKGGEPALGVNAQ